MDRRKLAYTIPEAAAALGVSPRSIQRLLANGDLAAKYLNRRPLILATELESWLDHLPSEPPTK